MSNRRWRFRQFLWPSQKTRTLYQNILLFQILYELNILLRQNVFSILKKVGFKNYSAFTYISGSAFFQKSYLLLHQLAFHVGFLQGYETMGPWLDLASLPQLTYTVSEHLFGTKPNSYSKMAIMLKNILKLLCNDNHSIWIKYFVKKKTDFFSFT